MKATRTIFFALFLFLFTATMAQTRGVANNAIPGDNNMRYYRLALPVTVSAYQQDLGSDYNNVLRFWQECEDFANRMFVPLGICFDVVEDSRLVMSQSNMIDQNIYNVTSFGTELTNDAVGSDTYDVGMWIHHRSEFDENTGLSVGNGVYNSSTKSSGYAKTDKWVVAHELGHMFGADFHTSQGEGSLMDNEGEFFSYPSILLIREESVKHGVSGVYAYKSVTNSAPVFDASVMKNAYRIPQGACIAIPVSATDEHAVTYSAIGCSSANIKDVNGEDGMLPHFCSLVPQRTAVIDYSPKYRADIYDKDFYFVVSGTDVPSMSAGSYPIAFLANDVPASTDYSYLQSNPFYSNYSVWDATVQIVGGTAFKASLTPMKNSYSAGETVTVQWGVNTNYFDTNMLRITMSADYGETFPYVLAESVPATNGSCAVTLPNVNVGNVDVDFVTATRSMRGGIIRVEEIGGVAYTLTTLSPESGGGFNVTGGSDVPVTTYTVCVAAEPAEGGAATVDGNNSATVNAGSTVTLSATANSGYKFDGWYLNGTLVNASLSYKPSVLANVTYVAKFSKEPTTEPEPEQPETPEKDLLIDGAVYQILNLAYTSPQKYILDNGNTYAQANTMGTDVENSLWIVAKKTGNCYSLKNCSTNRYLNGTTQQSGKWQMSSEETFVYIYEFGNGQYYISAVGLSDVSVKSMSCAHNPGDHTNLVTWYNVDDKGSPILASMWNFVEYVDEKISYAVTDQAGNVYNGTYDGDAGKDRPVFDGVYGYELVNEKWNGNTYEATIVFPYAVSKEGENPNEILIAFFSEEGKVWRASGNDIKVQSKNDTYPVDINSLWAIYPVFNDGRFTFVIKSVANGKYVYSDVADNTNRHDKQGTVVLGDTPSGFEYVQSGGKEGFRFVGKQSLYLSINSVNDNNVYMGVYSNPHTGTKIYDSAPTSYGVSVGDGGYATFYAEVPVAVPDGVEVYYLAENGVAEDCVVLTEITEDVIPAGVGVVLKAKEEGVYNFDISDAPSYDIKTLFKGTVAAEYVAEESYVLSQQDGIVGLYLAEMNDIIGEDMNKKSAFLNNGHKVYLPKSRLVQSANYSNTLRFVIPGTTAVEELEAADGCEDAVYDLSGRKLEKISLPGIYVVNGKKKIVR